MPKSAGGGGAVQFGERGVCGDIPRRIISMRSRCESTRNNMKAITGNPKRQRMAMIGISSSMAVHLTSLGRPSLSGRA
jgi:hypothetical protein